MNTLYITVTCLPRLTIEEACDFRHTDKCTYVVWGTSQMHNNEIIDLTESKINLRLFEYLHPQSHTFANLSRMTTLW